VPITKGIFYEYELPLKLTPPGHYESTDDNRARVWPAENSFDIDLSLLQAAKEERNRQMLLPGSSLSISDVFVYTNGTARISVSGNPNMSNIKVIMIGVRNPIKTRNKAVDDGSPKYGEVWFDELRLNDFIENGGWAATDICRPVLPIWALLIWSVSLVLRGGEVSIKSE